MVNYLAYSRMNISWICSKILDLIQCNATLMLCQVEFLVSSNRPEFVSSLWFVWDVGSGALSSTGILAKILFPRTVSIKKKANPMNIRPTDTQASTGVCGTMMKAVTSAMVSSR